MPEMANVMYPGLLSAGHLETFLDEIDRISDGNTLASHDKSRLEMETNQKLDGRLVRRIYEPCSHYPAFRDFSDSPRVLDAVERLLGPDMNFRSFRESRRPDLAFAPTKPCDLNEWPIESKMIRLATTTDSFPLPT